MAAKGGSSASAAPRLRRSSSLRENPMQRRISMSTSDLRKIEDDGDGAQPEMTREYPAFGDKTYPGVEFQTFDVKSVTAQQSANVCHFIGPNGELFDAFYNYAMVPEECESEGCFNPYDPIFISFPKSEDYKYYTDFEQALVDWHHDCEIIVGNVKLPKVMGRVYARPKAVKKAKAFLDELGVKLEDASEKRDLTESETSAERKPKSDSHSVSTPDGSAKGDEEEEDEMAPEDVQLAEEMDHDPWDCQLYPAEPSPEDYDTEQEYETAMCRWGVICSQLDVLPPHARHFEHLLNIKQCTPEREVDEDKEAQDAENLREKLDSLKVNLLRDWAKCVVQFGGENRRIEQTRPVVEMDPRRIDAEREDRLMNQLDLMRASDSCFRFFAQDTNDLLRSTFSKWVDVADRLKMRYGVCNAPIIPVMKGSIPREGVMESGKSSSGKATDFTVPLKRSDVTPEMIEATYDSAKLVRGKTVEFRTSAFALGKIDLEKILPLTLDFSSSRVRTRSPEQIMFDALQNAQRKQDRRTFLDNLNSHSHPALLTPEYDQWEASMKAIFQGNLCFENVRDLVSSPLYVDTFQAVLGAAIEVDDSEVTNIQRFLGVLNEDNIDQVLDLFDDFCDPVTHGKIAHLVAESLQQSPRAQAMVKSFISTQNVKALYHVSYAITFFNEIPMDVWPYCPDIQHLVMSVFGDQVHAIIHQLMVLYYLSIIMEMIRKQTYLYVAINNFVSQTRTQLTNALAAVIKADRFFLNHLFLGISHRSSRLSAFFLFVLIQLLSLNNVPLRNYLQSDGVDILKKVRDLSYSKFTHVQYACRRLFMILQGAEWRDWLIGKYSTFLWEDIITLPRVLAGSAGVPLLMDILGDMCSGWFRSLTKESLNAPAISQFTSQPFFHSALQFLVTNKGKSDQAIVSVALFLSELIVAYYRLSLFEAGDGKAPKVASNKVLVQYQDVRNFLMVLQEFPERAYEGRTTLVKGFRWLLKDNAIFEMIRKENVFYTTVHTFCKDGRDQRFTMESWRMFYQCIRYHSSVLEWMHRHNLFASFLEMVGTSAGNMIMMAGLHYIGKLFCMVGREQERIAEGKESVRDDLKAMEKDVKLLTDIFMKKHLFIKIHMIFKRFTAEPSSGPSAATPASSTSASGPAQVGGSQQQYPGAAFHQLAEMYESIVGSSYCNKLMKDVMKNPEYRAGVSRIHAMICGSEEVDLSIGAQSGKGALSPGMSRQATSSTRPHKSSVSSSKWK